MRLLVRSLGSPVPQEVRCTAGQSVGELLAALATGEDEGELQQDRHKLVYRGRVLHDPAVKLCDVVTDGGVLVLLPRRSVAPCPPPPEPTRGPTLREINAAIRDDLAAQGPGRLEAAEAAARREGQAAGGGAGGLGAGLPDVQALEQALLSGEMGALRAYLDQLQEALRGAEGLAATGGGAGGAAAGNGEPTLAAALDLMFNLGGAPGGQAAAQHGEEEGGTDEEEEEDDEGSEEGTEDLEEEEEYTDEEEDEEEEEGASEEEEEHGGQLAPPQVPDPDSRLLAELMEMGFPEPLCRNALLMGRNRFEPALEWLLEHAEDPAAAEPLSDAQLARLYGRGPRRAGPPVDQGALAMLQDMGFDRQQAEQALRTFNNSLNAATSWLLNLGALAAAAP
ncbi:Ubiquitin carboxyl-terminal hydrolase [Chlorella sorokiniana]|uniref:Ubiquitin carboxyl-terminal hydrolase n=1 Tax=Chlorella sorokiniana TaxID=3076 RepID=A0A2P6TWS7_CHLSO|nr:Ubiquitin carboxyl-terminal hydrolase [Chlorella sorokiniana]|eukprot:PRW58516.1 Ubiquitin carboxyl-terminal hydrolase [Chlorella sorokiniana]